MPPVGFIAQTLDGRRVRVIFSEPVEAEGAGNVANYSITSPNLDVLEVEVESDTSVILTTSEQTPGTAYTVVISNITDLAGNTA